MEPGGYKFVDPNEYQDETAERFSRTLIDKIAGSPRLRFETPKIQANKIILTAEVGYMVSFEPRINEIIEKLQPSETPEQSEKIGQAAPNNEIHVMSIERPDPHAAQIILKLAKNGSAISEVEINFKRNLDRKI